MPVNKLWICREALTDGSPVFDGTVTCTNLQFVTEDDAIAFAKGLRELVANHTNSDIEVRYNPDWTTAD
jgi:hypothetical protein